MWFALSEIELSESEAYSNLDKLSSLYSKTLFDFYIEMNDFKPFFLQSKCLFITLKCRGRLC